MVLKSLFSGRLSILQCHYGLQLHEEKEREGIINAVLILFQLKSQLKVQDGIQ